MKERGQDMDMEARLFAAELNQHGPELDLHGFYPEDVSVALDQFFAEHDGEESIRIIHGIGKGVIAREVSDYLKKAMTRADGFVADFRPEKSGGSVVVVLRK